MALSCVPRTQESCVESEVASLLVILLPPTVSRKLSVAPTLNRNTTPFFTFHPDSTTWLNKALLVLSLKHRGKK